MVFSPEIIEAKDVIIIEDNALPKSEREAILVLTGFGSVYHNTKGQKAALAHQGFDVYIPDYISRKSIEKSAENVAEFMVKHDLAAYKKVHVLAYIFGSWTFSALSETLDLPNLSSVVSDRSPLQEQLPGVLLEHKRWLGWLLFGCTNKDLATTPYRAIDTTGYRFGLLIETKASKPAFNSKQHLNLAPELWPPEARRQPYSDHCYIYIHHDEMYTDLNLASGAILFFFTHGAFPSDIERDWDGEDPFRVWTED
jgi:hypothetical protein